MNCANLLAVRDESMRTITAACGAKDHNFRPQRARCLLNQITGRVPFQHSVQRNRFLNDNETKPAKRHRGVIRTTGLATRAFWPRLNGRVNPAECRSDVFSSSDCGRREGVRQRVRWPTGLLPSSEVAKKILHGKEVGVGFSLN